MPVFCSDVPTTRLRSGKGEEMEKVCCVCSRVKKENSWVKEIKRRASSNLSHGYCPECYHEAMRKVMNFGVHFQPAID